MELTWIITLCVASAACVSWALTEGIKHTLVNLTELKFGNDGEKHRWWAPMLIALSLVLGFLTGALVGSVDWSWVYGGASGVCGGALASTIVAKLKARIEDA
jgi:hypothetical protein